MVGTDDRTIDQGDKVTFIPCRNKKGGYAAEIRIISRNNEIKPLHSPFNLKKNPFTPQIPISDVSKFAGRTDAIYSVIAYLSQSCGLDYQETAGILGDFISKGIVEKPFRNQYRFVEPMFSIYLKIIFDIE
ncbi:hypothetical protein [Anaerotignum propionicum]|uniref:hypothetical protein n=1 Tax=Anaerotignum propionicum TaxID=28446 RepID=UPI002F3EE35F